MVCEVRRKKTPQTRCEKQRTCSASLIFQDVWVCIKCRLDLMWKRRLVRWNQRLGWSTEVWWKRSNCQGRLVHVQAGLSKPASLLCSPRKARASQLGGWVASGAKHQQEGASQRISNRPPSRYPRRGPEGRRYAAQPAVRRKLLLEKSLIPMSCHVMSCHAVGRPNFKSWSKF